LNLLRVSLNRSLILPQIDLESDDEMQADEEDVSELCAQINNLHSSSDNATLKDVLESGDDEPVDELSDMEENDATPRLTMDLCQQDSSPREEPEPTMCSSPKIQLKLRKSIFSSLGHSVSKGEGVSVRTSLQSTKLSATESLAASLHHGLHVIEEQENNDSSTNPRRSFVDLSFDHLALKNQHSPQKVVGLSQSQGGDGAATVLCSSCKKLVDGNRSDPEGNNLLGSQLKKQQESGVSKQAESSLKV
jgi:kinesin family member 15